MKANIDYNEFPGRFAHCLNDKCVRGGQCLRRQMALAVPKERDCFMVVNPAQIGPISGENCTHFLLDQPQQYAKGIKRLYDKVPHKEAQTLKRQIMGYLGRTAYYRCYRGERLISPQEQEQIRQLFLQQNINEEPQFDTYIEYYQLGK